MKFTYNGTASTAYDLIVEHRPAHTTPQKVIETFSIPGRSGNLLYDTGAYENVTVTYQVAYKGSVRTNAVNMAKWLYQPDYCELTDEYEPLYYRKAVFVSPLNVADILGVAGRANITFNCKPQRFLISGKSAITPAISSGDSVVNNYEDALPIITVSGSGNGTLTVGDTTITITGMTADIVIDSERQTAESGGQNANSLISLSNGFPVLENGSTVISWTGGITGVQIIPNWWVL